jgi:surface polysaccharide O-acyltransferase-like enzyme
MESAKRLIGIDLIKIIACFLVVVLHTCRDSQINISSIMYYTGVVAIPLFFMTNGYLLFGKVNENQWYSYKKIGRILLLTVLLNCGISILYAVVKHSFRNPFPDVISNLFFQQGFFWHFWFFGALILIYVLFPVFNYLYQSKRKYFFILSASLICIQCLVDALNIYSTIKYHDLFQSHIPQTFRIESHFSYFILGGVLKLLRPKIAKYASLRNVLFLYGLAIIYQIFMTRKVYHTLYCEYFYDSLIVICLSVILFSYLCKINNVKWGGVIYVMSSLVMLIYIFHPFVIRLYEAWIDINSHIIKLIIVFSVSALLSWIISKIPYAKVVFKI